jgi:hypothetical protein
MWLCDFRGQSRGHAIVVPTRQGLPLNKSAQEVWMVAHRHDVTARIGLQTRRAQAAEATERHLTYLRLGETLHFQPSSSYQRHQLTCLDEYTRTMGLQGQAKRRRQG